MKMIDFDFKYDTISLWNGDEDHPEDKAYTYDKLIFT
jgi:hypothetical protein